MFSLTERKAIITGASQGLGRGFAVALAEQEADVALVYLRRGDEDRANAEAVRAQTDALGRKALLVEADVTRPEEVARMRDEVVEGFGRIDILVNNVGGFPTAPRPLVDMTDEDWRRSLDLNLTTAFLCCRAVAPVMVRQGHGRIINISASLSAFTGVPTCAHYSAAKAGVVSMTKALARELARAGVTANVVAPGHIDTPMTRLGSERGWWDDDEELAGIALGRGGTVEDVACAVVFFASNESGWITGQTLHVNGGSFMW